MSYYITYSSLDQFVAATVHGAAEHNTPHNNLIANDIALDNGLGAVAASVSSLQSQVSAIPASNPTSWDWTQRSFFANGYQKFPGGLIIQWKIGTPMSTETTQLISFPITFPSLVFNIQLTSRITTATLQANQWFQIVNYNTSGVTVFMQASGAVGEVNTPFVLAIGY